MAGARHSTDWNQLLQGFAETLSDLQQRLEQPAPETDVNAAGAAERHLAAVTKATTQHAGLDVRLAEITHWVDAIEAELRVSEDLVRVLLGQTEAVRQKLATWAGRAIG